MKKGFRKCVCCEQPFDFENDGYWVEFGEDEGKPLCTECHDNDSQDAETIVYWNEDEKEKYYLGSYTVSGEYDESERPEVFEYLHSIHWVSNSAWRGYTEGKPPKGWITAIDTWFGSMDGYNLEDKSELFEKKYDSEEKIEAPCPIIVGFLRTSNCCSCGLEVLIKEEDQEKFDQWLLK